MQIVFSGYKFNNSNARLLTATLLNSRELQYCLPEVLVD
jgi:hypothetical protein